MVNLDSLLDNDGMLHSQQRTVRRLLDYSFKKNDNKTQPFTFKFRIKTDPNKTDYGIDLCDLEEIRDLRFIKNAMYKIIINEMFMNKNNCRHDLVIIDKVTSVLNKDKIYKIASLKHTFTRNPNIVSVPFPEFVSASSLFKIMQIVIKQE